MHPVSGQRRAINNAAMDERSYGREALGRLIEDIYDAALDQAHWPIALERSASYVGCIGASLLVRDDATRARNVCYLPGIEPYYQKLYVDKYVELDPLTVAHLSTEHGRPIAASDVMSYREFTETRFYREWVRPQSLVDFVSVVLDKSESCITMFRVFRHERDGMVDASVRHRMMLLVPHLRRAVVISRMFDAKQAEAGAFSDAFDEIISGLFLVDAGGRVAHANRAGRVLLAAGEVLRCRSGRLAVCEPQHDQALRRALAAFRSDGAEFERVVLPLNGRGGERYVAHVLPLASGARRDVATVANAVAAIFVRNVALPAWSPEVIGNTFKLTPAEVRVLLAIVDVGGVPDVAAALGVAETTIKTHLARLFEKTGATRQADLVKLVAGYAGQLTI